MATHPDKYTTLETKSKHPKTSKISQIFTKPKKKKKTFFPPHQANKTHQPNTPNSQEKQQQKTIKTVPKKLLRWKRTKLTR